MQCQYFRCLRCATSASDPTWASVTDCEGTGCRREAIFVNQFRCGGGAILTYDVDREKQLINAGDQLILSEVFIDVASKYNLKMETTVEVTNSYDPGSRTKSCTQTDTSTSVYFKGGCVMRYTQSKFTCKSGNKYIDGVLCRTCLSSGTTCVGEIWPADK